MFTRVPILRQARYPPPPPGGFPSAEPPPPPPGYARDGYPPPPPPGYQGYFNDGYPPLPPQHSQHQHYEESSVWLLFVAVACWKNAAAFRRMHAVRQLSHGYQVYAVFINIIF
ncbi:hypothetical protein BUALT_Bualt05G0147100 [Buddleja alternifolia]|uniref:Uncharacterized protein n=1 Tax=Buddleja alternifolia TaxID=168488 RepID=A0AAV6XSG8_9LAMI|nr:hypothetical protein BUALT_Bualt05G0147100 [Buddleja alternifolia]